MGGEFGQNGAGKASPSGSGDSSREPEIEQKQSAPDKK
jgi:hypothetical protein